ncbi:transient receptor potential cation channel subfamily M member 2 isoform X1 [Talpa occidentalis]|uniref:transient receptor potential cation channel subfamily M member 2 isoform X1 n=1 Tax=Talpa occidentalis TaxID=50954 RepID=UPI0018903AAD|nr:transient receptor potential cation channel subfamily M member 2 isoform X1 [Talpa occidentalis]
MELTTLPRAGSRQEDVGVLHRVVASLPPGLHLRRGGSFPCENGRQMQLPRELEKDNLRRWVSENIRKKVCVCFMESTNKSDAGEVVCACGYTREQHLEEATRPQAAQDKKWDRRSHVREMPTDAFGDIVFKGLGHKSAKKYIRAAWDTPPRLLYELMTQRWGLKEPNLLISVAGGAKNFHMKPRLKSVFQRGLVKVAQTTGAWIITGGSHVGVMKQVGEAVRASSMSCSEGDVVTIGVATWGSIHGRESLVHPEGSFPAEYTVDEEGQGDLTCLDSNHSHFILVDDGTHGQYWAEIELRTSLEKFISEWTNKRGVVDIKIPIVCVVLEGGTGTLKTIYDAITRGTPCVVMEGSGRVADVIAQVAGLPVSGITIGLVQQKLGALLPEVFAKVTEPELMEWTKKIQDIVRRRQLLTIFREGRDGQQDVDVAILQALLKVSRSHDRPGHENWLHQLQLAVAWNRVDIARSEIFTDEWQRKPSELHPVMMAALIANKPEFVQLFLENGVQLTELVTRDKLLTLYRKLDPACLFHRKLERVQHDPESLDHVSRVLQELLGDSVPPLYGPRDHTEPKGPCPCCPQKGAPSQDAFTADPVRDLLLWAVVQNRRELAEIVWGQSRDCIAAALACTKILKALAKEEHPDSQEMQALAGEYEDKAIGVFTECHRKDEDRAWKLLTRPSEAWGKTTCRQLALEADDKKFASHVGVQAFLTSVWQGQLSVDNGLWEPRSRPARGLRRLCAFLAAPVGVFCLNVLSYCAFLGLFAYVLMADFQRLPSCCEIIVYVWIVSLACEELRQLLCNPHWSGPARMARRYFSDSWNQLDVAAIVLFMAGLVCRLTPGRLYPGRVILSLDFIMFCLRFMHIFTVSKTLGPKIIMLKQMTKDVFFFLLLLAVWVVSFGVANQAILIHNERRVDWIFRGAIYQSYLAIFGQIPDYIDGVNFSLDHCSPNGTDPYKPKCPESDAARQEPAFPEWLTVTLLCVYLLFTNILLLNLLIAMFNYTFQQVQDNTDQFWKFQRHSLIEEYRRRPLLPPPLILLSHLCLVGQWIVQRTPCRGYQPLNTALEKDEEAVKAEEAKKAEEDEEAELLDWEACEKDHYLQQQQQQGSEQKIQDMSHKVDAVVDLLEMDCLKQLGSLEQRLASLEEQVARVLHCVASTRREASLSRERAPHLAPQEAEEEKDPELEGRLTAGDPDDTHHVYARDLRYPSSRIERFPVPNEKVPWETEFPIYNPRDYSGEREDAVDPSGSCDIVDAPWPAQEPPRRRTGAR